MIKVEWRLNPQAKEIYKHFKGGEYEIVCVATDADDRTTRNVVYKDTRTGEVWVRTLMEFCEQIPRFKKV